MHYASWQQPSRKRLQRSHRQASNASSDTSLTVCMLDSICVNLLPVCICVSKCVCLCVSRSLSMCACLHVYGCLCCLSVVVRLLRSRAYDMSQLKPPSTKYSHRWRYCLPCVGSHSTHVQCIDSQSFVHCIEVYRLARSAVWTQTPNPLLCIIDLVHEFILSSGAVVVDAVSIGDKFNALLFYLHNHDDIRL